ncbi:MAG: hypothetical protein H0U95_02635 [Bacteroidetes bacterium]|nr:hypothetical protein [Bacteroidota bacterium]
MKNKIYILLFIVGLSHSGCKKYPEGDFRKQGPKTFITDKKALWSLALYEVNGIDSTYLIQTPLTSGNFYKGFLSSTYPDKKEYGKLIFCSNHNYSYGTRFINKNSEISFITARGGPDQCINSQSGTSCQRNIFNPEGIAEIIFKIQKLKDKECILTCQLTNNYKIILTKD